MRIEKELRVVLPAERSGWGTRTAISCAKVVEMTVKKQEGGFELHCGKFRFVYFSLDVSDHTRDSPRFGSAQLQRHKPSAKPHFLYFKHLNLH